MPRRRDEPGHQVLRRSLRWPLGEGRRERLLQRVFGQVEILDRANEARQDAPVFAPVQLA
jgi:hypothetical protein